MTKNDLNKEEQQKEEFDEKSICTGDSTALKDLIKKNLINEFEQQKSKERRKRSLNESESKIEIKSELSDKPPIPLATPHISPMVINPILYLQMIKNFVNNYSLNNPNNDLKFENKLNESQNIAKERFIFF